MKKKKVLEIKIKVSTGCVDCKNFEFLDEELTKFKCNKNHFTQKKDPEQFFIYCDNDFEVTKDAIDDIEENINANVESFELLS